MPSEVGLKGIHNYWLERSIQALSNNYNNIVVFLSICIHFYWPWFLFGQNVVSFVVSFGNMLCKLISFTLFAWVFMFFMFFSQFVNKTECLTQQWYWYSAGSKNYFSFFTGHVSFQIFLLVGHFTNWPDIIHWLTTPWRR